MFIKRNKLKKNSNTQVTAFFSLRLQSLFYLLFLCHFFQSSEHFARSPKSKKKLRWSHKNIAKRLKNNLPHHSAGSVQLRIDSHCKILLKKMHITDPPKRNNHKRLYRGLFTSLGFIVVLILFLKGKRKRVYIVLILKSCLFQGVGFLSDHPFRHWLDLLSLTRWLYHMISDYAIGPRWYGS